MTRHWKVKDQIDRTEILETKLKYGVNDRTKYVVYPLIFILTPIKILFICFFSISFYSTWDFSDLSPLSQLSPLTSLSQLSPYPTLLPPTHHCQAQPPQTQSPKSQVWSLASLTHLGLFSLFSAFVLVFRRGFRAMFVFQVCVSSMGFSLSLVFRAWVVVDLWVSTSRFVFLI